MERECSSQILPDNYFEWLKKNDRACFWIWGVVGRAPDSELGVSSSPQPASFFYHQIVSNQNPSSTQDRYECIIEFFDRWNQSYDFKINYLNRIKNEWGMVYGSPRPLKWLKEDDEQCRWALAYIVKSNVPSWRFNPVDTKELYLTVIAIFDLWQAYPDSKKLFLQNINKAWSQKKHRDTLIGKKALNTYLKEGTKQKLNELSERQGRKIHEVLEELIVREYERLK